MASHILSIKIGSRKQNLLQLNGAQGINDGHIFWILLQMIQHHLASSMLPAELDGRVELSLLQNALWIQERSHAKGIANSPIDVVLVTSSLRQGQILNEFVFDDSDGVQPPFLSRKRAKSRRGDPSERESLGLTIETPTIFSCMHGSHGTIVTGHLADSSTM